MPFGKYRDMKHCMSMNSDKKDPAAYCATMMRKMEGETMQPIKLNFVVPLIVEKQETKEGFSDFVVGGTAIDECTSRNGIKYTAKELRKAHQSLTGKPILKDHKNEVDSIVGKVTESSYNEVKKSIEYKGKIVDSKVKELINQGMINHVSIGATVRNMREETVDENKEVIAEGIEILELSLTPVPGIPNASIQGQSFAEAIQEAYDMNKTVNEPNEVEQKMENNIELDNLKKQVEQLTTEKNVAEQKLVMEKKTFLVEQILKTNVELNKEDLLKKEFVELELIKKYEEALAKKVEETTKARVEKQNNVQENNVVKISNDDDLRIMEAKAGDLVLGPDNFYIMPNYAKQRTKNF